MLELFKNYIKENKLIDENDKVIVAVSSGIDSIVLLDLFSKTGIDFGIAHCNFGLRGDESDGDEEFVKQLAVKYSVNLNVKRFHTLRYAKEMGISIQMAARELRYDWFEEIRVKYSYNKIALAHQKDDTIETFFINLIRGTGIGGLTGISIDNHHLIRPLLFASREDINDYLKQNNLMHREDSSNSETKYLRNKIRHRIIPLFKEVNPRFDYTMIENITRLKEVEEIFNEAIESKYTELVTLINDEYFIDIELLRKTSNKSTFLYFILKRFEFNQSDVQDIIHSLDGQSGKTFFSPTHRLIKDRSKLIISPIFDYAEHRYYIDENTLKIDKPLCMKFEVIPKTNDFLIDKSTHIAYLDYDKLVFPLVLRKWKYGEYFMPLGMDSLKKLSDFFIDKKLSISEKEKTWILSLGKDIIWVIGMRLDERFKITDDTNTILKVTLIKQS